MSDGRQCLTGGNVIFGVGWYLKHIIEQFSISLGKRSSKVLPFHKFHFASYTK
jgi:hypothetical protein